MSFKKFKTENILSASIIVLSLFLFVNAFAKEVVRTNVSLAEEESGVSGSNEGSQDSEGSQGNKDPEEETVTTYVKLPDQIIKKLIEIVTFDSDGDGIFDPDDDTPNLHNIFLVKDDNLNGIVDEYEHGE